LPLPEEMIEEHHLRVQLFAQLILAEAEPMSRVRILDYSEPFPTFEKAFYYHINTFRN